jgi:hypothetical protein
MVYKHQKTTPDWMYRQANLDTGKLPGIQKELLKLLVMTKKQNLVEYTSTFVTVEKDLVCKTCPLMMEELCRLGLHNNFSVLAFISVQSDNDFPPHVDVACDIGLNIPLINCKGTYTVWYDGKIKDQTVPIYVIGSKSVEVSRIADPMTVTEIGRCDASIPHWINVNMFHRPETHHDKLRIAASLRFDPNPVDEKIELWPHLIKE